MLLLLLEFVAFVGYIMVVLVDTRAGGSYLVVLFISSVVSFLLVVWAVVLFSETLLLLGFFFKLGFFPFIWWFPYISGLMSYFCYFMFGVVVKIFPLFLVTYNQLFTVSSLFIVVSLTVFLSLLNLVTNQNNIKVFLAWSSNVNLGWVVLMMASNWSLGVGYMLLYLTTVSVLLFFLGENNCYWDQFVSSGIVSVLIYMLVMVSFMGLPPFLGFLCKFMLFNSLVDFNYEQLGTIIFLVIIVLVTFNVFVYINMLFKLNVLKSIVGYQQGIGIVVLVVFFLFVWFSVALLGV
uniref:NADH-ubiquinone oxidoreductase chain 2 n=1 Tax=Diversibipalium mayottensis TaxID=3348909 RepID=A0A8K1XU26_9PLAT|nr:NADH dehydrogenase subunit 2 [Diversibipalium sp. MNHN JL281]